MYYYYRLLDNTKNSKYENRAIQGTIVKKNWTEYRYEINELEPYIGILVECEKRETQRSKTIEPTKKKTRKRK